MKDGQLVSGCRTTVSGCLLGGAGTRGMLLIREEREVLAVKLHTPKETEVFAHDPVRRGLLEHLKTGVCSVTPRRHMG